ncbi:MAG TPA: phosphopantothenoylcysteine decarboxylase, partial [Pontiella sp.]|nr:phosphopantothenoylcysteine decarboxylase [Pontiella sp.]
DLVSGPVPDANLPCLGSSGAIHKVVSAEDMLDRAARLFPTADVTVFAAAVSDYAPAERYKEKLAKSKDNLVLHLCPTPDIAKTLGAMKRQDQITFGFALQTSDGQQKASLKLRAKNFNGIVLNSPATLGKTTGSFSFLAAGSEVFNDWGCIGKSECARRIMIEAEHFSRD